MAGGQAGSRHGAGRGRRPADHLRARRQRAPLFLLHGYVGDGLATWRYQLDGLSDAFTVIAWDAPGAGGSSDPPESFDTAGYADALAGFIAALGLEAPNVAGLSFGGILALALYRRHPAVPRSLVLASAYAGWGGSLPPEVADQRLRQAFDLAGLSPDELVGTLLPTMFSQGTAPDAVAALGAAMRAFHPAGLRAMARASAEDLRAPLAVAKDLEASIPPATLVVLPDVGHVCSIEAPEAFNQAVRTFLQGV